jgi:hypothetical protein
MQCNELKAKLSALESSRTIVQEQWDLVRKYVVPYRGQFFRHGSGESGVDWRENRDVFDSTAINANNILSSSLHGAITNPTHQWFGFRFRRDDLSENREAAQWLRDCAQITFESLRDSNFNLQANEAYIDLTSLGTAFVTKEVLETDDGNFEDFLFNSVPVEESYFEQDYRGRVCGFYRKMQWSATMLVSKFGMDIPERYREQAKKGGVEKDITIVFAIYKRPGKYNASRIASPLQREYGYKYFLYDSGEQIGEEGGYYSMPALVMRWRNTADSIWGNSPAMIAMPDILTLNQLVELILDSLEKVVDPAIKTTERGLLSDLDLGPAGINIVRNMDDLMAFESRARFDVAELNREKLQQSIRSIFYVDQLELKNSPAMTATEVQVRYELMQRLLGPTLGRLESDFLDPLVNSAFADLMRYKRLPEPPQIVLESGDPTVNIEYTGPMARAQKLDQAQSLQQFLGSVAQLGEINPDALMKVDWDQAVQLMAEYYGAEPKILKSESKVRQERKQRDEQMQAMQQAQIMEQEGRAVQAQGEGEQTLRAVQ